MNHFAICEYSDIKNKYLVQRLDGSRILLQLLQEMAIFQRVSWENNFTLQEMRDT